MNFRTKKSEFANGKTPLIRFTNDAPPFLTKFACENILTLAASGSGKTSAIDGAIGVSMLSHDWALFKTCVKSDAFEDLERWARIAGKSHMLRRVYVGGPLVIDALGWALEVGGTSFAAQMLGELREGMSRGRLTTSSSENQFFADKSETGNAACLDMCHKAVGHVDANVCLKIWNTIPQSPQHLQTERTFCVEMAEKALQNCPEKDLRQLRLSVDFFLEEMVSLELRTRSSVIVTATIPFQALTRPPLCDLFMAEKSTITPSDLDDGAIIAVDVDGRFGAAALGAMVVWKFMVEHHTLNRKKRGMTDDDLRPICIFLAEGDKVLSSHDSRYSSMCRSARGCYYMSCQSLNSLFSEIGADPTGRAKVLNLIGNCNTHIYGCTCDDETLDYASKSMGQELVIRPSANAKMKWEPLIGEVPVGDGTRNLTPTWEPMVRREAIQALQRGGDSYAGAFVRTLGPWGIEKYKCLFPQNLSLDKPGLLGSMLAPDSVQIL